MGTRKMKLVVVGIGVGITAMAMTGFHVAWGQSDPRQVRGTAATPKVTLQGTVEVVPATISMSLPTRKSSDIGSLKRQLDAAMNRLREAKTDEARQAANAESQELLDRYFEADMQEREQEIAEIEQRVESLRALLDKRRAAKDEIIQLQLKVIEHEAAGLGLFGQRASQRATGMNGIPAPFVTIRTRKAAGTIDVYAIEGDLGEESRQSLPPTGPVATPAPPEPAVRN